MSTDVDLMKLRERMDNNSEEEKVSVSFSTIQSTIYMMNRNLTEVNETLKNLTPNLVDLGVDRAVLSFSSINQENNF